MPTGNCVPKRIRYWRPPLRLPPSPTEPTREEAIEQIRPVLLKAVALRMVADVPVGVFLSGGIDSSSIVAALVNQGHAVRTFSVVFGERRYDESAHSRQVARQFGTDHTELFMHPAKAVDEFDEAVAAYDQPSVDGLNTYFISQATRAAGVKVALSGLGGDELFAGYSYFRLSARLERVWPRLCARVLYQVLRQTAPRSVRTTKLGAILAASCSQGHPGNERVARYAVCRQVLAPELRREMLSQAEDATQVPLPPQVLADLEAASAPLDAVNAHSLLELSLYLGNMLLRDMDQMSMAHALELREPLLDHVLVETVARLPGRLKLAPDHRSRTKALLVDALPAALPDRILRRPKRGFVFPWDRWLRAELKPRIAALLSDQTMLKAVGFTPGAVQRLWNDFLASKPGIRYTDILALVHLLYWARQHRLAVSSTTPAAAFV